MSKNLFDVSTDIYNLLENPQGDALRFSKAILPCLCDFSKLVITLEPHFSDFSDPDIEIDTSSINQKLKLIFKGDGLYNQVFDPLEDEDIVTFSIVNDLCEIYEGLHEYLQLSNRNLAAAEWVLKENFRSHLYQHVLNSIKILYIGYCKDE